MKIYIASIAAMLALASTAGCGGSKSENGGLKPIEPGKVVFWHHQTTESADLLAEMVKEFNNGRQGLLLDAQYTGDYSDIFRKIRASLQAGASPDMAEGYQSMTCEYIEAGGAMALDGLIADPEVGFTKEEFGDFWPAVIETNRYPQFEGKMYSFPFCKSVLMMYFNKKVLAKAGISEPPATWDEFLEQCRTIKAKTGKAAYAINADASTIDGMVFSMGGEVYDGNQTLFDSPESLRVFKLLETLAEEELAYQIPAKTNDDKVAFVQGEVAFFFRSSSHRATTLRLMEGNLDDWGMARIPQADPKNPRTVLYGPNISIFGTDPEHNRVAWDFVRHLTSTDNTVRWALATGYLPVRKSATKDPRIEEFWAEWEYNRAAFDCLAFAKSEPNVAGWQEVRGLITKAETAVLSGYATAEDAVMELKKKADAVLASF